jgi:hypothetical protein
MPAFHPPATLIMLVCIPYLSYTHSATPGVSAAVPMVTHVHGMSDVYDWSDGYSEVSLWASLRLDRLVMNICSISLPDSCVYELLRLTAAG